MTVDERISGGDGAVRVTFRSATSADAEEVAVMYLASRKQFLPYAPLAHPDDEVRNWIRSRMIPTGNVVVAERDHRIVGMMATSTGDGISWVDQLYVAPEAVGQGIGARLLMRAIDRLRPPIRLHCFEENTGARRFYERHGFRPILLSDGTGNEEKCPDVLYELSAEED